MRKSIIRATLFALALTMLLASCATIRPYGAEHYFQALALDGQLVITINADLLDLNSYLDSYLDADSESAKTVLDRISRLSIALKTPTDTGSLPQSPSGFSQYDFYGAIEGNFPKSLVNTALSLTGIFDKSTDPSSNLKFYVDNNSGLQLAVPNSDIILFSSTSVSENISTTYTSQRPKYISDADAQRLADSQIGIYIASPTAMIDLGFDISEQVISNIDSVLILLNDNTLYIDFRLKSEELADSFSILIKGAYISSLRRAGIKPDFDQLRQMFTQQLNTVTVNGMPLTDSQKASITELLSSLLQVL